jgi:hypothetical protein
MRGLHECTAIEIIFERWLLSWNSVEPKMSMAEEEEEVEYDDEENIFGARKERVLSIETRFVLSPSCQAPKAHFNYETMFGLIHNTISLHVRSTACYLF